MGKLLLIFAVLFPVTLGAARTQDNSRLRPDVSSSENVRSASAETAARQSRAAVVQQVNRGASATTPAIRATPSPSEGDRRSASNQTVSRSATGRPVAIQSRATAQTARAASSSAHRASNIARAASTNNIQPTRAAPVQARSAVRGQVQTVRTPAAVGTGRATVARAAVQGNIAILGEGMAECRDAYFTCMDQFCGLRDDQMRRCICSGRLNEMRERERNFQSAAGMLRDFEDNNLHVVDMSANEVRAMFSASEGETGVRRDTSSGAGALSGVSEVLANRGSGDVAATMDRRNLWNTTGMIGEGDLADLEGTALYNSVHNQCSEMLTAICPPGPNFNMIVSAYGMQIEQDCNAIATSLDQQQRRMNNLTREARQELALARLEHHENHNRDEIIACLQNVKRDMAGSGGCGENNRQCLDVTGRFVNILTGEAIFSPDLFLLERQISLAGDILNNNTNIPFVNLLNSRRHVAAGSLDRCRDIADIVWDEYMHQTLVDLSQRQRTLVRDVRNDCITLVNQCYDERGEQLRRFTGTGIMEAVMGSMIELTEELCQTHLDSCAHLYGGGPPGLAKLREYVRNIQTTRLEGECEEILERFAQNTCTPTNDSRHGFPFQCRHFEVGEWYPGSHTSFAQDATLHGRVRNRAMESCVRPDQEGLTNEVEQIVSRIMDDVRLRMDRMLAEMCEGMGGLWLSNVFEGNWNPELNSADALAEFQTVVSADMSWGLCARSLCTGVTCPSGILCNIIEGRPTCSSCDRNSCNYGCRRGQGLQDAMCRVNPCAVANRPANTDGIMCNMVPRPGDHDEYMATFASCTGNTCQYGCVDGGTFQNRYASCRPDPCYDMEPPSGLDSRIVCNVVRPSTGDPHHTFASCVGNTCGANYVCRSGVSGVQNGFAWCEYILSPINWQQAWVQASNGWSLSWMEPSWHGAWSNWWQMSASIGSLGHHDIWGEAACSWDSSSFDGSVWGNQCWCNSHTTGSGWVWVMDLWDDWSCVADCAYACAWCLSHQGQGSCSPGAINDLLQWWP